jgi:transcriptional regulator with XRE-family HTH domain
MVTNVRTKSQRTTLDECWRVALIQLLERNQHLTQRKLAAELKISEKHLSIIKHGHTLASEQVKERVAEFFGLELLEMAYLGKRFLETGEWEPSFHFLNSIKDPKERALKLYEFALQEAGMFLLWISVNENAPGIVEYVRGNIKEEELYEIAKEEVEIIGKGRK